MNCLFHGGQPTKSGEGCPSAANVNRHSEILHQRMTKKNAEDVEHVVTVIGERERMDDSVIAHYHQHDCHCGTDDRLSWVTGSIGEGPYSLGEVLTVDKGPGEEGKVWPDVDHLCEMN